MIFGVVSFFINLRMKYKYITKSTLSHGTVWILKRMWKKFEEMGACSIVLSQKYQNLAYKKMETKSLLIPIGD